MLDFRRTADQFAFDVFRGDDRIASIQWHVERPPRLVVQDFTAFSLSELQEISDKLRRSIFGVDEERLNNDTDRRARVAQNQLCEEDSNKSWAVFMRTRFNKRWYYDGYEPFATLEEAAAFRDAWLKGMKVNEAKQVAGDRAATDRRQRGTEGISR